MVARPVLVVAPILLLVVVGQACILVTSDQSFVHGLVACALSLETRKWHELPLLDKEVASILTSLANLLKLVTHELPLRIADALAEGSLDVDGKPLWAFYS